MDQALTAFKTRLRQFGQQVMTIQHFGKWLIKEPLTVVDEQHRPIPLDLENADGLFGVRFLVIGDYPDPPYADGWKVGIVTRLMLEDDQLRLTLVTTNGPREYVIPLAILQLMYLHEAKSLVVRAGRLVPTETATDEGIRDGDEPTRQTLPDFEPGTRGMEH